MKILVMEIMRTIMMVMIKKIEIFLKRMGTIIRRLLAEELSLSVKLGGAGNKMKKMNKLTKLRRYVSWVLKLRVKKNWPLNPFP